MKRKSIEKIALYEEETPKFKNRIQMSCQMASIANVKHLICDFSTKEEGFILRIILTDKDFGDYIPQRSSLISADPGWYNASIRGAGYYYDTQNILALFERKLTEYNAKFKLSIGKASLKTFNEFTKEKVNMNSNNKAEEILTIIKRMEEKIVEQRKASAMARSVDRLNKNMALFGKETIAFMKWMGNNSPKHYMFKENYNKQYFKCVCSKCLNETLFLKSKLKYKKSIVCQECGTEGILYASRKPVGVTGWYENYVKLSDGRIASRHYKAYYEITKAGEQLEDYVEVSRIIYTIPTNNKDLRIQKFYHKINNFTGQCFWDDKDLYGMAHIVVRKGYIYPPAKTLIKKIYGLNLKVMNDPDFELMNYMQIYYNQKTREVFESYVSKKLYKLAISMSIWNTEDLTKKLSKEQIALLVKLDGNSDLLYLLRIIGNKPYSVSLLKRIIKDKIVSDWHFRDVLSKTLEYAAFDDFIKYIYNQERLTPMQATKKYSEYIKFCRDVGIDISTYPFPSLARNTITKNMLKGTTYQYSAVEEMYNKYSFPIIETYLNNYKKYPELEMIVRSGLTRIAILDSFYIKKLIMFPEEKDVLKKWGITKEQYNRLIKMNAGYDEFVVVQNENNWLIKSKLTLSQIRYITEFENSYCCGYADGIVKKAMSLMSAKKFIHYVEKQKQIFYDSHKGSLIPTWRDYLDMAADLKMDITNVRVFAPDNILVALEKCIALEKEEELRKKAAELRKEYPNVEPIFKELKDKYEYISGKYGVIVPSTIEDILREGAILRHCLFNGKDTWKRYWERMDERSSFIVFLRKIDNAYVESRNDGGSTNSEDVSTPFITLEIEPGGTVRQRRGYGDSDVNDEEVLSFIKQDWHRYVASRMTKEDIILSQKSAIKRALNYAELRKNKTLVWHGKHQGELLADIFKNDEIENKFLTA